MSYGVIETGGNRPLGLSELLDRLRGMDIVYIGEFHQLPEMQSFQADVISGFLERGLRPALCFEMFNVLQQEILNYYVSGSISYERLSDIYNESPEGFDLNCYRELLEIALRNKLRIIGLNIPRNIASSVAKKGLDRDVLRGLRLNEDAIRNCPEGYRNNLRKIYRRHPHEDIAEENFVLAQSIKDETMAETIAHYFGNKDSGNPFVVITGRGHVERGMGIPERVRGKLGRAVTDAIIIASYGDEKPGPGIADYIISV